jgi:cytochrome b561
MKTFTGRRCRNIAILCSLAIIIVLAQFIMQSALLGTSFITGWTLTAVIVFLAAYNLFKRVSFLPIGSSSSWLQLHIYCGLLTGVLILLHLDFRLPNGMFESILALVYFSVFLSGILGLLMSRLFPRRLSMRGEEVIFERIPIFQRQLREEVEKLVFECLSETETTAVPDFYLTHLKPYFERSRNFISHLMQSERPRQSLLLSIRELDAFLNETERETMKKIAQHVITKDDLDHQYTLQAMLKYWLFLHVPLTYGLLILIAFHAVVAHAFSGGV